jgi:hypothetical protein
MVWGRNTSEERVINTTIMQVNMISWFPRSRNGYSERSRSAQLGSPREHRNGRDKMNNSLELKYVGLPDSDQQVKARIQVLSLWTSYNGY